MIQVQNYINGEFTTTKDIIDDINPATGEIIAKIPKSGSKEVSNAVDAADMARVSWSELSSEKRADWLDKIADALESKSDDIASLESQDTGKPIALAKAVDASRSVANFRFFAQFSRDFSDENFEMDDAMNHVVLKPVGIAGLITPWNLPLYLLSWKIAPAIVMGNTVVAKPSELTPLTANLLSVSYTHLTLPTKRIV